MILVLLLSLLVAPPLAGQANPFVPGSASGGPTLAAPRPFGGAILGAITDIQRDLNQRVATLARQTREEPTAAPVLLTLFLAFLWGMVHAAGPGHGKTFTLSYFLAEKPRIARGLLFGALISFLDSVSAFVLVFLVYVALRAVVPAGAAEGAARILRVVSYVLITGIGVWHLVSHLGHGKAHAHGHPETVRADRRLIPLAVSIGLVPCPVSTIVLVFGLSIGAFGFGVILTLFLALGAATALSLVAFAAMALRSSVLAIAGLAAQARVVRVLEVSGDSLVVLFGVVLLISIL